MHPYNHPSIHLSIHLFIHPSIHPSIHPYNHLSIHLSIHTIIHSSSIHTIIHSSIYLSIHLSIHSFIHPSIHPYNHPFIHIHTQDEAIVKDDEVNPNDPKAIIAKASANADDEYFRKGSDNSYYTMAHTIREPIKKQPDMLSFGTLKEYQVC